MPGFFDLSMTELVQIAVSAMGIAFAFSYVWRTVSFAEILLTVGASFVLHELGHRYVAKSFGARAEYRMWTIGLIAALAFAILFGFVFAAPGAVYILTDLTKEQSGKVAIAGPAVNIILSIGFLAAALILPGASEILITGARVNAFLGTFNLIPMDPFDGGKVVRWNKVWWAGAFAIAGMLAILI